MFRKILGKKKTSMRDVVILKQPRAAKKAIKKAAILSIKDQALMSKKAHQL
jgi:hypothetical protein